MSSSTAASLERAARPLFARRGYAGTSIRDITRRADVNLGAVTYHFGSKRRLYDTVLDAALSPLAEQVESHLDGEDPAIDRLERAVRGILQCLQDDSDLAALLFQEIAAGRQPPAPVAACLRRLTEAFSDLVRQGKAYGSVEAGDPYLTATSVLAQTLSHGLLQRGLAGAARRRSATSVENHAASFVRRALSG